MTNKEAIEMLKSKMDGSVDTSYSWCEAIRLAIQALKKTDYLNCEIPLDEYDLVNHYKNMDDMVEVVRCKDCERRGTYDCPVYVGGDGMYSEPDDWFCGDGERKSAQD